MEQLYEKMLEFTKMTEELPFDQFQAYYQEVVDYLQKEYQGLNQEDLLKAKGICNITAGNAVGRGARKDANSKKFKKMAEKTRFWHDAIQARLLKEGLSQKEMDEKESELWKD